MSTIKTTALTPTITRADLPASPPGLATVPIFALIGAAVGLLLAVMQFSVLQNPEPTAIYTTIWTLLLWPFGLGGAGLIADHYVVLRQQKQLREWTVEMIVYTLNIQQSHVTGHTRTAVDETVLAGMVDSILAGRQVAAPEATMTMAEKIAGQLGKYKTETLTVLLSWIVDTDHTWTADQWTLVDAIASAVFSGTHSPKVKSTKMLSLETPPDGYSLALADHPTEVAQAVLEWVTDTQTEWTAPQWKLVEQIADRATREDYEPKIEVVRRRSRTS